MKQRRATYPFVVLCGASGVGKTAVRELLAPRISAVSLGRDDFDGDWNLVYNELDKRDRAVVECVCLPRSLRRKVVARRARVIKLTAPIEVRRQRLEQRGESEQTIAARLAEATDDLGYGDPVRVDLTLDTSQHTALEIASELAEALP